MVAQPVKFVTSLYYSTVSGENIGTSWEIITELSNLIMTVIVAVNHEKPETLQTIIRSVWCLCENSILPINQVTLCFGLIFVFK